MPNLTAAKTPPKEEVPARGRAPAPYGDFPFFMARLRDEFERMFDRLVGGWPAFWKGAGNGWVWDVDVRDTDEAIVVRAEAPGFDAGDFDLQVLDDRLVLRAAKKVEAKGKEGKVEEYRAQEYFESVMLPAEIDKDKVEAKYHNGVLTVTVPKTAKAKAKRIPVTNN
jgi:HSP20 family protein